jgi:hypothetical protein
MVDARTLESLIAAATQPTTNGAAADKCCFPIFLLHLYSATPTENVGAIYLGTYGFLLPNVTAAMAGYSLLLPLNRNSLLVSVITSTS